MFCIIFCIIGFSIIWSVASRFGALGPIIGFAHGLWAAPAPAPGIPMPPMLPMSDAKGFAPTPPAAWLVGVGAGAPQGLGMA